MPSHRNKLRTAQEGREEVLGGGQRPWSSLSHFAAGGPCMSHGRSLGLGVRIPPEPTPGIGPAGKESQTGVGGEARGSQSPCRVAGTRGVGLRFPCCLAPWRSVVGRRREEELDGAAASKEAVPCQWGEKWGARAPRGRPGLRPGVQHGRGWSGEAGAWGGLALPPQRNFRGAGCARLKGAFSLWTGPLLGWGLPEHVGSMAEKAWVPSPMCGGPQPIACLMVSRMHGPCSCLLICDPALVWSGCRPRFSEPTFVVRPSSEAVPQEPS